MAKRKGRNTDHIMTKDGTAEEAKSQRHSEVECLASMWELLGLIPIIAKNKNHRVGTKKLVTKDHFVLDTK